MEACPNGGPEVLAKAVIISDDFSRSHKRQKTKRFLRKRLTGAWL
jgi:hypothetical protein